MAKPIILRQSQWKHIRKELHTEYPKATFMLRSKMREVLGFTVREHQADWRNSPEIHLDFYSERKRTFFLLRWSEYINQTKQV